jgi:hypothetical protein
VNQSANCTVQLSQSSPTTTYTWNTGQKSTVLFSTTRVLRLINGATLVISIGTVTEGFDAGAGPAPPDRPAPPADIG